MISTAIPLRPGQSTSPHLVITNASPCGPSGISSRTEAQKIPRCIEHTATPTDVVCVFWMPCNDWFFSGSDCADPIDFDSGICHGSWLCLSLKVKYLEVSCESAQFQYDF